ncbi:MAG: ankyrin repeat domain-containing protein [Desulfomonilaceae bacterium]
MGSLRTIQGEANRLRSKERRDQEKEILLTRALDFGFALHGAVARKDVVQTTCLLEQNRDLIPTMDLAWTFNKALTGAIHMGLREMVRLLLRFADVNRIEENTGKTPIIYAVMSGDPEMVKLLLDAGADPNRRKGRQKTALFHARKLKRGQIVSLLIAAGAKE